ncbi:MAG: hypothetical protein MUC96_10890 [Myxococcaceae bacterium]|jgi:hypothetical protein|nr:hypothetical protein [Myxococcaceae bacterium]
MSLDVLRSVAGPMLNSLSQLSRAAPPSPTAAPTQAARGGLQVLDGFDQDLPAVQSKSPVGATSATNAMTSTAGQPQVPDAAQAQGAESKNPLEQLLSVFTDFVKKLFSSFLGGLFGQGQGGGAVTPNAGGAAAKEAPVS